MKLLVYTSDKSACSWQRSLLPCYWMQKLGLAEVQWGEGEDDRAFSWADLVVYQRWYGGRPHQWFLEMWRRGVPLTFELDDDVWDMQRDNPFTPFYDRETLDAMTDMIRKSRLVTVPSKGLAAVVSAWNANVAVIPNGVDPGAFDLPVTPHPGDLRLGFSGSRTHDRDFRPLMSLLPALLRKYPHVSFHVIGDAPTGLAARFKDAGLAGRIHDRGWVTWEGGDGKSSMYEALASVAADVALVPLDDIRFNRGKSAIKFYENSAFGTCLVAAATGIYTETITDGVNGRLVPGNTEANWRRVLEELIEDEPQRVRLGQAAREHVRKTYAYDVLAPQWAAAYRRVLE